MNIFKKRKYVPITPTGVEANTSTQAPVIPDGMWIKCPLCGKTVFSKDIGIFKICPKCNGLQRMGYEDRLLITADTNSFKEMDKTLSAGNPLDYPGYKDKIEFLQTSLNIKDAVVTGTCTIENNEVVLGIMDSRFIMGSMGSVVGEKLTRAFEFATKRRLPVIIFTASGGARMQEGIVSLMQMAKVSAAVKKHSDEGLLYISVITDPTTGGVTASFAMLGDIILAEPGAIIGFAGRRVIEQTIKENLPDDFQKAEFLLEKGFIDSIVPRMELKPVLANILKLHKRRPANE